jgi:hypothetical protein
MKNIVLLNLLFFCFIINAEAQTKSSKKKAGTKKAVTKKTSKPAKQDTGTVVLKNTNANAAYAPAATTGLRIADPTINALNQRAAGADINLRTSPIVGMPKGTYGIANGRILLRNTTATTSGTSYGSGAVGTGTSIIGTGTSEATIGVNGKSPYAGPWLWGDRRPVYNVPVGDSARQQ